MAIPIPLIAAGATALGSVVTSAMSARQARKNREFQERMSSTAHQREVADLRAAGINPMLRHMSGAATPTGDRAEIEEPVGKGVTSGLAVRQAQAQLRLMEAQTGKTEDEAYETRVRADRLLTEKNAGLFERFEAEASSAVSRAELDRMSVEEKRQLLPLVGERARAEIDSILTGARAAEARALLDDALLTGRTNWQRLHEIIGRGFGAVDFVERLLKSEVGLIQKHSRDLGPAFRNFVPARYRRARAGGGR